MSFSGTGKIILLTQRITFAKPFLIEKLLLDIQLSPYRLQQYNGIHNIRIILQNTSDVSPMSISERQAPLLKFQILTFPSRPPVNSLLPEGSKVMDVISLSPCTFEYCIIFSPVSTSQTLMTDPMQPHTI